MFQCFTAGFCMKIAKRWILYFLLHLNCASVLLYCLAKYKREKIAKLSIFHIAVYVHKIIIVSVCIT